MLSLSRRVRRGAPLAAALVCLAAAPAADAATHSAACTEPDGRSFRVTYESDVPAAGLVQARNLQTKAAGSSTWTTFGDFWGDVSNLTWWTPSTATAFLGTADPHPAITLYWAGDVTSFHTAYGNVDQRAAVLGQPVYGVLQPRVTRRSTGDPSIPEADSCSVFLTGYNRGSSSAAKRLAVIGDSITVQMHAKLRAKNASRMLFQEPQSGRNFGSILGELRGMVGGLRNPYTGVHQRPDALVMAMATNDAGRIAGSADAQAAKTGFGWIFARALIDTGAVGCRVLVTTWASALEPGYPHAGAARLADAQQHVNGELRKAAAGSAGRIRLVDWAAIAKGRGPNSGAGRYYESTDWTHPNAAGIDRMSTEITAAVNGCLG